MTKRTLTRSVLACVSLLLCALGCELRAQEAPPSPQQEQTGARMIDEFGDIQISDWLSRMDNLAIELQNAPAARGVVVASGVPNKFPGWPLRRAYQVKGYLIKSRGIDAGRVEVLNGGYRDEVRYQLWVVESGARPPVLPFDLGAALARERTPLLFDRLYPYDEAPSNDIDAGYAGYLYEIRAQFAPLAEALGSDPAARACLIAYAAHRDRRGADRRIAARQKLELLKNHSLAPARVVALAGGRRRMRLVELWIVPPGSPLPKPTPEPAPARRRR